MVKYLKIIHNWTGFVISLIMLVVLITGVYLGGIDLLKRLDDKGQSYQALSNEQKAHIVEAAFDKYPQISAVKLPTPSSPFVEASSRKQSIYLTSSLDEIEVIDKGDNSLWRWLFFFHRNFQLDTPGKHVNAISAILATVIMFIGVYLWWLIRKGFKWKHTVPKSTKSSALIKSHIQLGLLFSIPLIIMAITGAYITYGPRGMEPYQKAVKVIAAPHEFSAQIVSAQALWPNSALVAVSKPRRPVKGKEAFNLNYNGSNIFALQQTDSMQIDRNTGELISAQTFSDKGFMYQAKYSARFLHDGARMPTGYLVVLLLSSVAGALMVCFALTTFVRKEFLKKK